MQPTGTPADLQSESFSEGQTRWEGLALAANGAQGWGVSIAGGSRQAKKNTLKVVFLCSLSCFLSFLVLCALYAWLYARLLRDALPDVDVLNGSCHCRPPYEWIRWLSRSVAAGLHAATHRRRWQAPATGCLGL